MPEDLGSRVHDEAALDRLEMLERVRMSAQDALAEDDEGPGQDVGALHRDLDGRAFESHQQRIPRAAAQGRAAQDVHGVHDRAARHFRLLVLRDGGDDRRPLPLHCLLYTSDAADERSSVDLGGRRIMQQKKTTNTPIVHRLLKSHETVQSEL